MSRELKPCGTPAAYQRHLWRGEEPCRECREAARRADRGRKRNRTQPRELQPCGTRAAYQRHRRAGEEPCGPCREANRTRGREEWRKRHRKLKPCGTPAAYGRHKKAGEEPCGPCRQAWSDYINAYNKKKRPPRGASLPASSPEGAHRAPCFGNPDLWDPRGEFESDGSVRARWREAARLCVSACPVLAHCRHSRELAGGGGVWAGQIPGVKV